VAWPKEGPNYRPAQGYVEKPASGIPASGIPAGGPGLWGDAGGAKPAFSAENQPDPEAKSVGHELREEFRKKLATKLEAVEAVYDAALVDPDNRVRLVAAKQISVELWGQPNQSLSGPPDPEGKPTSLMVAFVKPSTAD